MGHFRNVRPTIRRLPAVGLFALLLAAGGCDDELNDPQPLACDEQVEISVADAPASLRYLVAASGNAVVESVTYTTTEGEMTTTDLDDQAADGIVFDETVEFAAPVEAILRARGEVSAPGEIGIAFTIIPEEGGRFDSDPVVCRA